MITKEQVSENQIIQMFNAKKHVETLAASEKFLKTFQLPKVAPEIFLQHQKIGFNDCKLLRSVLSFN